MAASAPTEDVDAESNDERDQFGSEDSLPNEKSLFGSDVELPDEKDLFGDDEGADGLDYKALFGSDDEAAPTATQPSAAVPLADAQPPSRADTVEPSEMDEEEIFGNDLSDEEGAGQTDTQPVVVRRSPMLDLNGPLFVLKLPNINAVERKPFDPSSYKEDVRTGYKSSQSTKDKQIMKLLAPENVIRWRFRKNEDGQILQDDNGRPQYESNSRIVEWEDGSRFLHVGREVYQLRSMTDTVFLFEENSAELNVCHGIAKGRLTAIPRSLDSKTHNSVKNAQLTNLHPSATTLLTSKEGQRRLAQQRQIADEQRKRQELRDKRLAKQGESPKQTKMSAAFLENDQSDDGALRPSVKRPKVA